MSRSPFPRSALLAFLLPPLVCLVFPLACRKAAEPARESADGLFAYEELVTGSASKDDALPLVIAIHGLGDDPEHYLPFYRFLQGEARVIAPRALTPYDAGYSWFSIGIRTMNDDSGAGTIRAAADRLAEFATALQRERPTRGKPIVTGFSQGGILSFALAALHPGRFSRSLPIAGTLTDDLRALASEHGSELPMILAFHGSDDMLIPIEPTRRAVAALRAAGASAELKEYPGVGHHISPAMHKDYFHALEEALLAATAG